MALWINVFCRHHQSKEATCKLKPNVKPSIINLNEIEFTYHQAFLLKLGPHFAPIQKRFLLLTLFQQQNQWH